MKLSKFLVLSFGVLCLPLQSFGGAGSHGGNSIPSRAASPQEIEDAIKNTKPALVLVAQKLQTLVDFGRYVDGSKPEQTLWDSKLQLLKRLFPKNGQPTIYSAIHDARFSIEDSKPCYEGKTEVDASVETSDGSICFSVFRLTKDVVLPSGEKRNHLTVADMNVTIAALGFHEVSHKLNFNEQEARLVQADALANLTNETVVKGLAAVKYFNFLLGAADAKVVDVEAEIRGGLPQSSICVVLGEVQMRVQSLSENLSENPLVKDIQILTAKEQLVLGAVIGSKAAYATLYCGTEVPGMKGMMDKIFKGQSSVPLLDLIYSETGKPLTSVYTQLLSKYRVYNTATGGTSAVQQEMVDLEGALAQIRNEMQARWNIK